MLFRSVILGASIPHLNPLLRWGQQLPSSCCSDDARTGDTGSLELAEGNRSRGGGDDGGKGGGGGRAPNRSSARGFTRLGVPERAWSGAGGRNQLSQSEENILAGLHGGSSGGFGEKKADVGGGGDHDGDGDGRWDSEGRGALPRAWVP